jgi:hypothetical protein
MQRRRTIAAGPVRTASDTWKVIVDLISVTLGRAAGMDQDQVRESLSRLSNIGPMLVGPRHLERHDLVLAAGPLELAINTVSGADALSLDENLNEVPGAAGAGDWDLWVPEVEPLAAWLKAAVEGDRHLHVGDVQRGGVKTETDASRGNRIGEIDFDAFRHLEER